jgi:nitroreductase
MTIKSKEGRMKVMDVLQAIYTRRSIRKFSGEPISDEDMEKLLRAGFSAPSAHNKQPWNFVVVKNKSTLEHIAANHPYAKMLPQAGCCIIVCGDENAQETKGFLIEDCSAAIQNILLAAHGIGLGAVWSGLYPVPELTKMISAELKLPDNITPVGMVVVGHKTEDKGPSDRYDSAKIHYDQW